METRAPYEVHGQVKFRPETLLPYGRGWQDPTREEIRGMLAKAGQAMGKGSSLTGAETAALVGVESRTVRRWLGGDSAIPYAVWAILAYEAGFGEIWKSDGLVERSGTAA
jgi:hypothetical protein